VAGRAVAPPIVGENLIWLLTDQAVYAFRERNLVWKFEPNRTTLTFATAVRDDTLILCGIDRLIKLDAEGLVEFDLKFQESLSTPPVVDATGQIYVASKGMVYAFV
jgi:outer membrane protein assembly factor BamB